MLNRLRRDSVVARVDEESNEEREIATLQSIHTSRPLHNALQNMCRDPAGIDGMLRDREYNNDGDGKNTVATVRDTMRDERKESEKRPRERETVCPSKPFTSSCWPSPPTW